MATDSVTPKHNSFPYTTAIVRAIAGLFRIFIITFFWFVYLVFFEWQNFPWWAAAIFIVALHMVSYMAGGLYGAAVTWLEANGKDDNG